MKILYLKLVCKLLIVLFLLPFLGCSTGAKQEQVIVPPPPPKKYQDIVSQAPKTPFEQMLESTKRKDIENMTDRFGFPAKSFKHPNENRVFEYNFSNIKRDKSGEKLLGGLAVFGATALGVPPMFSGPVVSSFISSLPDNLKCAFWLEVNDDDVIRKWRWEGKDCASIYQKIRETAGSNNGIQLGVEVHALTPELNKRFNVNPRFSMGALVTNVFANSPAEKSGIMRGDVITEINRKTIHRPQDLLNMISRLRSGDTALMLVYRNGEGIYVAVKL